MPDGVVADRPGAPDAAPLGPDADELGTIVARDGGSSFWAGPLDGFGSDGDAAADGPEADGAEADADGEGPDAEAPDAGAVRPRPAVLDPLAGVDAAGVAGVDAAGGAVVAAPLSLAPGRAYEDAAVGAALVFGVPLGLSAGLPSAGPPGAPGND